MSIVAMSTIFMVKFSDSVAKLQLRGIRSAPTLQFLINNLEGPYAGRMFWVRPAHMPQDLANAVWEDENETKAPLEQTPEPERYTAFEETADAKAFRKLLFASTPATKEEQQQRPPPNDDMGKRKVEMGVVNPRSSKKRRTSSAARLFKKRAQEAESKLCKLQKENNAVCVYLHDSDQSHETLYIHEHSLQEVERLKRQLADAGTRTVCVCICVYMQCVNMPCLHA